MTVDPVTFEVVRHRLDSINDEAAITLQHVSGSPIAVESNDLNTAITTAEGHVVACGHYILAQVASIHLVVADIIGEYATNPGFGPGDQFLTNDPYVGTLHQPDVVLVAPVFVGDRLVAWVGSTVHQADVGGPNPGGMTYDARSVFDEPIPMPPVRIVENDRLRRDIEREYLIRSRTPELNALDLAGQVAANRSAAAGIRTLCERYGVDTVVATMARLLDATEGLLRERLAALPDGRWRHVAHLEHGPGSGEVYAVRLTATKRGDRLELDFSDSSDQAPGAINCAYPALANFTMAAVLVHLCGGLPWVPGALWRVVRIVSREGSVVHARWPAGVAMSTSSTAQAVRSCVSTCLARMLDASDEHAGLILAGCQLAGGGGAVFSGVADGGRTFAAMTLDELCGGAGARSDRDGADSAGVTTSPGASCANVEVNESYLPVRYLTRAELADSAGPGRFRGGVGSLHVLTPYGAAQPIGVLSFGQGLQHPAAAGVGGGDPGRHGGFALLPVADALALDPGSRRPRELPVPRPGMTMADGEAHVGISQGGGGFGDPLERDPAAVAADVGDGLVTEAGARRDYGVVLTRDPHGAPVPDGAATGAERHLQRCARLGGRAPRPPAAVVPGRRFSSTLRISDGPDGPRLCCARCGGDLCAAHANVHAHLVLDERPVPDAAPLGFRYPGSERFVVRHFHCGHCAAQVDVLVALRGEPLLHTAEPLLPADPHPAGDGHRDEC